MSIQSKNTDQEEWDIIVKPKASFFKLNFKEVWAYKDLILLMSKRDITSLYKQTMLGPLWMIIQPVFTTAIYTFTFTYTAKISTDGIPPILFFLISLAFWNFFSDILNKTSNTFISNAGVFGKVYFPRLVVPISIIISSLVKLMIQLALAAVFYFYYYVTSDSLKPNLFLFLVPVLIVMLGLFGMSLGIIFSAISTKYRDFTFLLAFAVQLLMFASCVVFPLSIYTGIYQKVFLLNPIVNIIELIRYALTGSGLSNMMSLLSSFFVIIVFSIIGIFMFNRTERSFMDTV